MNKTITLLLAFMLMAFWSQAQVSILLVNDNDSDADRVIELQTSLNNLGYSYVDYDAATAGGSPTAAFMNPYDLVIWYTGNDGSNLHFWNGDETDNEEIKSYIDGGGMMWLQGLDFLFDRYGGAADTFVVGDFVYDYLGIEEYHAQSHWDNDGENGYDGVPYFSVVEDNGIFTLDTIYWSFNTLWGVDALVQTDVATPLYIMGPPDYGYAGYVPALYLEKGDGKVMTFSIETARLDSQERLDTLFQQGLDFFDQFASGISVSVESITLSADGDPSIDTKGGTLQMSAAILPADATNPNVHWSLINNQANASINQSGVLSAFGTSYGNGTTTVIAEAVDGSGISAIMDITISGQGDAADYEVLLVNDNANDATRYESLDVALTNLGHNYALYNTVVEGDFPSTDLLNSFDAVMWYTGNDGVDLKLWDISDTLDYKFNAPLVNYLDNNGLLWLSGLDFLFDVYGSAPFPEGDDLFTEGQFIYDYMGIAKYVAQSRADDGGAGVAQMDVVLDNSICELSPVIFAWATLWFADALILADDAEGIYNMGPSDYIFSPFNTGVYKEHGNSKVLTFTFEIARLDEQDNIDQLVDEVLTSFENLVVGTKSPTNVPFSMKNFPNPASNYTTIVYGLSQNAEIELFITDMNGKQVYASNEGEQNAGQHEIQLSTELLGLPTGTYFYTIIADGAFATKKMLLLK